MPEHDSKRTGVTPASPTVEQAVWTERRQSPRYPFTATAEAVELQSRARIVGRTADLGRGGCYVDTISPFPVGTPVKLRLSQGNRSFECQAAVIYSHVGMGMGLAFTEVGPDQQSVLQEWLGVLSGELTPSSEPQPVAESPLYSSQNERHVLNQLISLLIRKRILTETEGMTLLRELFR